MVGNHLYDEVLRDAVRETGARHSLNHMVQNVIENGQVLFGRTAETASKVFSDKNKLIRCDE